MTIQERNKIISDNMGLAYDAAKRHAIRGTAYEDRVQGAFVGMMRALEKFDPTRGKLPSYLSKGCYYGILELTPQSERRARKRGVTIEPYPEHGAEQRTERGHDIVEARDEARAIMEKLTPRQREAATAVLMGGEMLESGEVGSECRLAYRRQRHHARVAKNRITRILDGHFDPNMN